MKNQEDSFFNQTIPFLRSALQTLITLVEKTEAHCNEQEIEPKALLEARLFPNMFGFSSQIHIATDLARRGTDRLAGLDPSSDPDDPPEFTALKARIERTITRLNQASPDAVNARKDKVSQIPMGGELTLELSGERYFSCFLVPNLIFHVTTAYNILRTNGVTIGKRDYLAPFLEV